MNKVSVYSTEGWIEDLPDLLLGRSSHGCGHYVNDDNKLVTIYVEINVDIFIVRYIW